MMDPVALAAAPRIGQRPVMEAVRPMDPRLVRTNDGKRRWGIPANPQARVNPNGEACRKAFHTVKKMLPIPMTSIEITN